VNRKGAKTQRRRTLDSSRLCVFAVNLLEGLTDG
jgi:hypothetical protein